ncbi:MAG: DUF4328 domain-containing protein, partial [Kutzneria sp.]|nr:DUF4328 domain-containing protein [Kutzneria sp.]
PRWGFPQPAWRWPAYDAGSAAAQPVERLRMLARNAVVALWLTAAALGAAAIGEGWRFVLVLLSRNGALPRGVVAFSDALVVTAGVVSMLSAAASITVGVLWVVYARWMVAKATGHIPARTTRQVVLGLIAPMLNVVLAGSVLAELEHSAGGRSAADRPRPSRLLLGWWASWVVGQALFGIALLNSFDGSVQGMANGIELHLFADLVAVVVAVTGAILVNRITTLLEPIDADAMHRLRVVKVINAPEPQLRPVRPLGSLR